jgi:hypothetical protein
MRELGLDGDFPIRVPGHRAEAYPLNTPGQESLTLTPQHDIPPVGSTISSTIRSAACAG